MLRSLLLEIGATQEDRNNSMTLLRTMKAWNSFRTGSVPRPQVGGTLAAVALLAVDLPQAISMPEVVPMKP